MKKVRKALGIDILHEKGIKGKGINVAVLDSGISDHPDFGNRIIFFKDFVNRKRDKYDDEGHGTHVAGILAGDGKMNNGRFCGMAPEAGIVSLKVLDNKGRGREEDVLEGIWWIIDHGKQMGIKTVNMSFGTLDNHKGRKTRLLKAVELLWDLGYIVVASAGNNGPGINTVSMPGNSEKVITVGASDDRKKTIINGRVIANYSGRGTVEGFAQKPDVVAPAGQIYSCGNQWRRGYSYVVKSGTSMSTPIVTGTICLLLSQRPYLDNEECKNIIRNTALDIKMERNRQGYGLINPIGALNYYRN